MPPYLTRKGLTYYFRQAVPAELRQVIGKREIKASLGRDFAAAVRQCKRLAVKTDDRFADARATLDAIPADPYDWEAIKQARHLPITELSPDLSRQYAQFIEYSILETDRDARIEGLDDAGYRAQGEHIQGSISALRQQLATGKVDSMRASAHFFLVGRGYDPQFSDEEWRRVAYLSTEASLAAYEKLAQRHQGVLITSSPDDLLPSQFEIQAQARTAPPKPVSRVTWDRLLDIWRSEFPRRANTQVAYEAALRLFQGFCDKSPEEVSREDVLAFRDFLSTTKRLAPGTVANKIGFVGTLINSGRNHAELARYLTQNPFENIRVKRPMRGESGGKRLPFSDNDLKAIFGADIYTEGKRPRGGAGEAAAWIPALAYLTGMRLEEIASLRTNQFYRDAEGQPYLETTDGKNLNSIDRQVPIHPALVEAGLLDFVNSRKGRLFPLVKCSNEIASKAYSQWFGRHLSSLGITSGAKVFHSFRHLFKDLCRNAGLDDSTIDQICGHEPGTVGGRYGSGRRVDVLAKEMARIKLPVALPKIFFD